MNAPVTRRALLGATAAIGAVALPAVAEATIPTVLSAGPDAALSALIARWSAVRAAYTAACERCEPLWATYDELEPVRSETLHWRPDDGLGCGHEVEILSNGRRRRVYGFAEVGKLMDVGRPTLCEASHARREEVLAAHHAWLDECRAVKDRMGLTALEHLEDEAFLALSEVEEAIVGAVPATFAGLVAKARWATGADMPAASRDRWTAGIVADVLALAERGGAAS